MQCQKELNKLDSSLSSSNRCDLSGQKVVVCGRDCYFHCLLPSCLFLLSTNTTHTRAYTNCWATFERVVQRRELLMGVATHIWSIFFSKRHFKKEWKFSWRWFSISSYESNKTINPPFSNLVSSNLQKNGTWPSKGYKEVRRVLSNWFREHFGLIGKLSPR